MSLLPLINRCFMLSAVFCLGTGSAVASIESTPVNTSGLYPVFTILGGYANIKASHNQTFVDTNGERFVYYNHGNRNNAGFLGTFLGAEKALPYAGYSVQMGVEYSHFGSTRANGLHLVGIEPATSTSYFYHYHLQTDQVLAMTKWLTTAYERFHPYASIGLGAAFNHAGKYQVRTSETGSINLTPDFSNHQHTGFSYSLGLGVDATVNPNLRVGLGYRFSDFGKQSLGNGRVVFNDYSFTLPFTLSKSNAYANQLQAQISYLFHNA